MLYYFSLVDEYDKQAADSLLPIISSQRERFRTRNLELEAVSLENINPEAITQRSTEKYLVEYMGNSLKNLYGFGKTQTPVKRQLYLKRNLLVGNFQSSNFVKMSRKIS